MKEKHETILNAVKSFMRDNGYSPSIKELAEAAHYSCSTICICLVEMKKAGLINFVPGQARTITVPGYVFIRKERAGWK